MGTPLTDREIDLLVIKTINEIIKHITFEEDDGLCVAGPALDALRDAFKSVVVHSAGKPAPVPTGKRSHATLTAGKREVK